MLIFLARGLHRGCSAGQLDFLRFWWWLRSHGEPSRVWYLCLNYRLTMQIFALQLRALLREEYRWLLWMPLRVLVHNRIEVW